MLCEPVLTAAEVAALLKVNVETVYALIRREGLPAARVGGQWRFSETKVRTWFESRHHVPGGGEAGAKSRMR